MRPIPSLQWQRSTLQRNGSMRSVGVSTPRARPRIVRRLSSVLGFRTSWHAEAAELVPNAEVVIEPTFVTEVMHAGHDVFACGQ